MDLPRRKQIAQENAFALFNKLKDPRKQSWILLNPTSLGDTMVVCALLKAFREKHGAPITMVMSEKQVPLGEMYVRFIDHISILTFEQLERVSVQLADVQTFCIDQPFVVNPMWQGDGRWEPFFELFKYPKRGGIGFCDLFRHVLRLEWDVPLEKPVIPEEWRAAAVQYADSIGMMPGKSVIIFPDNNSVPSFSHAIWQPIADAFNAKGYKVFTNMAGNSKGARLGPLYGTSAIGINLQNAIPLVERAGRYISGNNGMMCVMMVADVKSKGTILIYDNSFSLNGFDNTDPLPLQSFRYMGFTENLLPEYRINPDGITQQQLEAVVENEMRSSLVW